MAGNALTAIALAFAQAGLQAAIQAQEGNEAEAERILEEGRAEYQAGRDAWRAAPGPDGG